MSIVGIILLLLILGFIFGGIGGYHSYGGPGQYGIGTVLIVIILVLLLSGRL